MPTPSPLLAGTLSHEALRDEPVYLDHRGRIVCADYVFRDDRGREFRRLYRFCGNYLMAKGLPLDISAFREKGFTEVVNELNSQHRDSITKAELIEIVAHHNQIARIRELVLRRAEKLIDRAYWRHQRASWRPP